MPRFRSEAEHVDGEKVDWFWLTLFGIGCFTLGYMLKECGW